MGRQTLLYLALAATGCDRVLGLTERAPDAAPDTPVPLDAQICFGSGMLALCLVEPIPDELVYAAGTSTTLDTSVASMCLAYTGGQDNLCVIGATTVQIDGALQGIGSRPLVIVGSTITLTGTVTVASTAVVAGAGNEPVECVSGAIGGVTGGGGSGGSFGGRGGNGGGGNGSSNNGGSSSAAAMAVTYLRGGCQGQRGHGGAPALGLGGGAVAIVASSLTLAGVLNASGSGGTGGPGTTLIGYGGCGGGSGGMIVIDAQTFVLGPTAMVFANGGGGGEGGGNPSVGNPGESPTAALVAAPGGKDGTSFGGHGGDGSAGTMLSGSNGRNGNASAGGGGAGGGAGVIRFVTAPTGAGSVSPAPS